MGTVREFTEEDYLPKDYLVEKWGKFFVDTEDIFKNDTTTFEKFYNKCRNCVDEHCYKGMENV